jgi:hypothetical protein
MLGESRRRPSRICDLAVGHRPGPRLIDEIGGAGAPEEDFGTSPG